MLKVQLIRDLRKNILRGHPWVYREALEVRGQAKDPCLCEVLDKKGKQLGWGIYSPEGPLALRVLSTDKKPPNNKFFEARMMSALGMRKKFKSAGTNAYRLFNGEGDFLPGLVCDIYADVAVLQFDGPSCNEFWDQEFIAHWLLENTDSKTIYCKPRRSDSIKTKIFGRPLKNDVIEISENDIRFLVNIVAGQKTGFFLDQRDNRKYLGELCENRSMLNLFSYTGGFSIYAGKKGAKEVTSVDLSAPALELADKSWALNGMDGSKHKSIPADVFEFIANESRKYDVVMVDPPSMSHSEKTKAQAMKAYTDLFAKASALVSRDNHLVLSSCSSHIHFDDFLDIIDESLSVGRRKGRVLRISGQGSDHPTPHYCRELRYLKFVHLVLD